MAATIANNWHFDILEFVKVAKENGVNEKFAEYQARQIETLSEVVQEQNSKIQQQNSKISILESREPATKGDLEITKLELQKEIEVIRKEIEIVRKEIEVVRKEIKVMGAELKSNLIWWILGTGATTIIVIAGLLKLSLH
jgi:parvulin-like peptidyl-prolyl isomerase